MCLHLPLLSASLLEVGPDSVGLLEGLPGLTLQDLRHLLLGLLHHGLESAELLPDHAVHLSHRGLGR